MKLSIIIPVFNEKKSIIDVIKKVHQIKYNHELTDIELVVVDDCSTDGTSELLEKNKKELNYIFISLNQNKGKGFAVREGIKHSSGELITIQDADLELIP